MTAFKGTNVTKYTAPPAIDNEIDDGYIKATEKVWIDSLAFTAVITTGDTIEIASIPPGKKITSVEVYYPAITPTSCTIQVGVTGDTSIFITSHSTTIGYENTDTYSTTTLTYARMNITGAGSYVTTGSTNTAIVMQIGVTAMTAPTAGTINTIVRYT